MDRMSPAMIARQEQLTADIDVMLGRIQDIHSKELLLRNDLRNNVLDYSRFANKLELVKETRRRVLQKEEGMDDGKQNVCTQEDQRVGQLNGDGTTSISSSSSFASFALSLSSLQAKLTSSFALASSFSGEGNGSNGSNGNNDENDENDDENDDGNDNFGINTNCNDNNENGGFCLSSSTPVSPKKSHSEDDCVMLKEDKIAKIDMEIEELREVLVQLTIRIEEGKQSKLICSKID